MERCIKHCVVLHCEVGFVFALKHLATPSWSRETVTEERSTSDEGNETAFGKENKMAIDLEMEA